MAAASVKILGIESSCDDTSVAILENNSIKANLIANQAIHAAYGGVVPELASRAHQKNIVPVLHEALKQSGFTLNELNAIAFTNGPGLKGSLLVGSSFAKGLSIGLNLPLIEVNHMQAHILAHFIDDNERIPEFPFICLTVSGGHTQLVLVKSPLEMEVIGQTLDDAAGEAFDKAAKMLGLPYPGGPLIDKHAQKGNPLAFKFSVSKLKDYQFSYSGLKTNILYFLQKQSKENPDFIREHLPDLCASIQKAIVDGLLYQTKKLSKNLSIKRIAISGGVSANSELRKQIEAGPWESYLPKFEYCTDNAAMIAIAGYYQYKEGQFGALNSSPNARMRI